VRISAAEAADDLTGGIPFFLLSDCLRNFAVAKDFGWYCFLVKTRKSGLKDLVE
jgi:hypothetical protein